MVAATWSEAAAPLMSRQFDRSSYADPNGRLEPLALHEQGARRQLLPHYREVAGALLGDQGVRELMAAGRIVATRVAAGDAAAPAALDHDVVWPLTFPGEWLGEMLADAGLLVLDIASTLVSEGFELQDGTPRNVVFQGSRPVFVDFTSMRRRTESSYWGAFDQFAREVLHPALLCSWGMGDLWRHAAFARPREGVSAAEVSRAMPLAFGLRRPIRAAVLRGMARRERQPAPIIPSQGAPHGPRSELATFHLQRLFQHLRGELARVRGSIVRRRPIGWQDYYQRDVDPAATARKTEVLSELLGRTRPKTVLDLGANTGKYAILAAEHGARVVAADRDEGSLAALYEECARRSLPITPVVMDAACPTPSFGLGGTEFPAATERFRADLTMVLGLVHHLVVRNDYTFERLADAIAAFGSRTVAVEFIGAADPRAASLRVGLRHWYTLDECRRALARHFPRIETVPLSGERSLITGHRS